MFGVLIAEDLTQRGFTWRTGADKTLEVFDGDDLRFRGTLEEVRDWLCPPAPTLGDQARKLMEPHAETMRKLAESDGGRDG